MKNHARARKVIPVLDALMHFTPMVGRQAEAWEVPVYIAFLMALHALADEKGRIKVGDVVEAANRVIAVLVTRTMHSKSSKVFDQLVENFIFACEQWRGFNDRYWLAEGYKAWALAGRPDDKTGFHSEHPWNKHFYNACDITDERTREILARINAASPAEVNNA